YLRGLDERRWSDWRHGKPLSAQGLRSLLSPYDVHSDKWGSGKDTTRGYMRAAFGDAWQRYLPNEEPPPPPPAPKSGFPSAASAATEGKTQDPHPPQPPFSAAHTKSAFSERRG